MPIRQRPSQGQPGWVVLLCLLLIAAQPAPATATRAHVDSLNSLGRGYLFSNIQLSVDQYGELAKEARALGYRAGEARALQNQGVALYLNGRHEEGIEASLRAIRIFEELDLRRELASVYGELGYQIKRRNPERASDFMRRGIDIAEAENDSLTLCALYDNFGVLHELADRPDSAAFYYHMGLDLKLALTDSLGIPYSLNHLSSLAAQQGNIGEARRLLAQSDRYRVATGDGMGLLSNKIQAAELSYLEGDAGKAAEAYERLLQTPAIFEHGAMVTHCYQRLAAIYEELQDYEQAYQYQLRHASLSDSLYTIENNARMAALELEFETEKKDRQLAENRLEALARTRQVLVLGAALVLLTVLAVAVVGFQHQKRGQLRQEMELHARLQQVERDQEMTDEKLRISRELHDNIGAQLTFLTSSIDNMAHRTRDDESRSELDAVSSFSRQTMQELRHTVWAMKNEAEGLDALIGKLQDLKQQCGATGRRLVFEIDRDRTVEVDLASGRMLNVLRIAQEAIQNALKHTQEGDITMRLVADAEGLRLSIRDRGPGFSDGDASHPGGLSHMRLRCNDSGGSFSITSGEAGTEVMCHFPPK
ncbi:hypothetical protein DRQ53_06440 [bacterium]|nr:MAG: hypothetical protein DRQ53_06440 [bacterium]